MEPLGFHVPPALGEYRLLSRPGKTRPSCHDVLEGFEYSPRGFTLVGRFAELSISIFRSQVPVHRVDVSVSVEVTPGPIVEIEDRSAFGGEDDTMTFVADLGH